MDRNIKSITLKRGNSVVDVVQLPEGGFVLQQTSPQFGTAGDIFAQILGGWMNVSNIAVYKDVTAGTLTTRDRATTSFREDPKQSAADYFNGLVANKIIERKEVPVWAIRQGRLYNQATAPRTSTPVSTPIKTQTTTEPVAAAITPPPVTQPVKSAPVSNPVTVTPAVQTEVQPPADVVKAPEAEVQPPAPVAQPVAAVPVGSGQTYEDPVQHALWTQRTEALNKLYADNGMGRPEYLGKYINFSVHKDKNGKEWAYDRTSGQWMDVSNSKPGVTSVPSLEEWMKENPGKEPTDYDTFVEGEKKKSLLRQQAYNDDLYLYGKGKGFFGTEPEGTFTNIIGMLGRPNI